MTYWDDVYGFKMTCMKSCVVREASVEVVNKDCIVSESCVLKVRLIFFFIKYTTKLWLKYHRFKFIVLLYGFFEFTIYCSRGSLEVHLHRCPGILCRNSWSYKSTSLQHGRWGVISNNAWKTFSSFPSSPKVHTFDVFFFCYIFIRNINLICTTPQYNGHSGVRSWDVLCI